MGTAPAVIARLERRRTKPSTRTLEAAGSERVVARDERQASEEGAF
jgi:hypothetical protein